MIYRDRLIDSIMWCSRGRLHDLFIRNNILHIKTNECYIYDHSYNIHLDFRGHICACINETQIKYFHLITTKIRFQTWINRFFLCSIQLFLKKSIFFSFWLRMYSHGLRACVNVTAHFLFFCTIERSLTSSSSSHLSLYIRTSSSLFSLRLYNLNLSFTRSYCCF